MVVHRHRVHSQFLFQYTYFILNLLLTMPAHVTSLWAPSSSMLVKLGLLKETGGGYVTPVASLDSLSSPGSGGQGNGAQMRMI